MRPDNLLELFEINPAATDLPRGTRPDPAFDSRPLLIEFHGTDLIEAALVDPKRAGATPTAGANERPPPLLSTPLRGQTLVSWAMAVGVYLLTLLLLFPWDLASTPPAPPIPVHLVIEQPPPPQPPPLAPKSVEKPPLPNRLASVDMGEPAAKPNQSVTESVHAAEAPHEAQTAAAAPPAHPKPPTPSELVSALPKPSPEIEPAPAPPEAEPTLALKPQVKQAVAAHLGPTPHLAPKAAPVLGPAASRNEYLAYCMALIARNRGMLPPSMIGGRRGVTVLRILVRDNGTIEHIAVAQSSGYPDIDSRVEQMVASVRRFPPVPQWFQESSMPLIYNFAFPNE